MRKFKAYLRPLRAACVGTLLSAAVPTVSLADGMYFVKEGDTLYRIAGIFGVTVDRIRELNRIEGIDIKPGDRLRIPEQAIETTFTREGDQPSWRPASEEDVQRVLCREETVYHRVTRGETLTVISRRYGTPISDLQAMNGLRRSSRLSIGQRLLVRRSGPRTHVVRRGDTLGRIASHYRTTAGDIMRLNQLPGNLITPGQRLIVEACDQGAHASAVPTPPSLDAGLPSGDLMIAVAEAAALATVYDRDRREPAGAFPAASEAPVDARSSAIARQVISLAKNMLDIPYRFGGSSLRGIDCSAYVQRVFGLVDVALPRTAREQFRIGESVGRDDLSVGDLVFFRTYASFPSHVGIYIGENLFIHASSVARKVTIDSLDERYYTRRFLGGRRLPAISLRDQIASTE